jgi:predicted membrane protein
MLFQLCRTPSDLDRMLKLCAMGLVAFAVHGIVQFIVVALGLVAAQGSVDLLGYEFVDVGWAGIYRVAFPIGDFNLVRIQSFFQEPGFFAFYLLFGLVLLDCVRARVPFRHAPLCAGIIKVAMLLTLSLTGIVLMLVYLVIKTRSWPFRGAAIAVALIAIDFIVFNESEFIAKTGSLDMRLENYALLETFAASWENIVFGIGFGNETMLSELRVNNFLAELLMYSSVFGLLAMLVLLALALNRGHKTNHIVLMVLLYSLSTPMLWSPLFLLAIFMSGRLAGAVVVPPRHRALAAA